MARRETMEATSTDASSETSTNAEAAAAFPTVHGRVVRSVALTQRLREVTLGGFAGYPLMGGDEFVYVMVSAASAGIRSGYGMREFLRQEPGDPVRGAYYTVRRARPSIGEIDLWVVDHGHAGAVGSWLSSASAGDPIALWGPRRGFEVPGDSHHVLLVADEAGFAAVAALIDGLLPDCRATAVLETVDAAHRPSLPGHTGLEIVWVDRGADAPGANNRLLSAVQQLPQRPDAAFGAGESRQMTAVRRHVRDVVGIPADRVMMTGYWRLQADS